MITFDVSRVDPAGERLPSMTLEESLRARSRRTVEAAACNLPDLVASSAHGFIEAVETAFDWHYPLVLSPDDVWLCIAQGFATHVNLNAEALRGAFVRHEGKVDIVVRRDEFVKGSPSNDWTGVFSELSDKIREHVGNKRDLVVADFSTSGIVERAASEIVLFDALQSYFNYTVCTLGISEITLCGIPEITLLGTAEDWISIRRRASVLAEFDLSHWTKALLPVLDQIVRTAQGSVDRSFWRSFYKWNDESDRPYVTGWINVLFPYVETWDSSANRRQACRNDSATSWASGMNEAFGGGPAVHDFPVGLSSAPFVWDYLNTEIPMVFSGGFTGISQNVATGAVRPAIGWAIGEQ
jgi:hypothetical protein